MISHRAIFLTITKTFSTMDQAEKYHHELCDKYNIVNCVKNPPFGEEGIYAWECSDPI